jgi:hypothetical protein
MLATLYPQEASWYSFLLEVVSTQGDNAAGRIGQIEKKTCSDLIGSKTFQLVA